MRWPALTFDDAGLEAAFRAHRQPMFLRQARLGMLAGGGVLALFGLVDALVAPEARAALVLFRFGVLVPTVLVAHWLTRFQRVVAHLEALVVAALVLVGLGLVLKDAYAPVPGVPMALAGLMLVLMFGYGFSALRAAPASLAGALLVAVWEAWALWLTEMSWLNFVVNSAFLLAANAIGMFSSNRQERRERDGFLQLRVIEEDKRRLAALNQRLESLATRDALTGLFNRRLLDERLREMSAFFRRYKLVSTVIVLDLDGFKQVNDRLGHAAGDELLRLVARVLREQLRETDTVFRQGGDEFCVVLPNTPLHAGVNVAERLLAALLRAQQADGDGVAPVGFSAGCVAIAEGADEPDALLSRADALLYRAKRSGKSRVCA